MYRLTKMGLLWLSGLAGGVLGALAGGALGVGLSLLAVQIIDPPGWDGLGYVIIGVGGGVLLGQASICPALVRAAAEHMGVSGSWWGGVFGVVVADALFAVLVTELSPRVYIPFEVGVATIAVLSPALAVIGFRLFAQGSREALDGAQDSGASASKDEAPGDMLRRLQ